MRKTLSLGSLEEYFRTWSSLHAYHESHADDASKKGGGENGDIVDRLLCKIKEGLQGEGKKTRWDDEVEVAWPLVLMMIRRK